MSELIKFDDSKIELIKRTIAKGATDDEFQMFLHQARRTGLDPLARQIHFQKFRSKNGQSNVSIITSIDGYRLVADRTGSYAGSDDYAYDEGLGRYAHINTARGLPKTATATVYKIVAGTRCPFVATVSWDEYFPGDSRGFMWKKMPYLMLGKCAEALALRKAFPAELSGVYTKEEMDQAQGEIVDVVSAQIEKPLESMSKMEFLDYAGAKLGAAPKSIALSMLILDLVDSNGNGYKPEAASHYLDVLETEAGRLLDFADKCAYKIPFWESQTDILKAMFDNELSYSLDDEPALFDKLNSIASQQADQK